MVPAQRQVPLAPDQPNRPVEARRVDQRDVASAVTVCHDPAGRAAHRRPSRLDADGEQPDLAVELHDRDMESVETDEQIAARAVAGVVMAARSDVRRRLGQRRGPSERVAWSLLILRASTPLTPQPRSHRRAAHPRRNSEEPAYDC